MNFYLESLFQPRRVGNSRERVIVLMTFIVICFSSVLSVCCPSALRHSEGQTKPPESLSTLTARSHVSCLVNPVGTGLPSTRGEHLACTPGPLVHGHFFTRFQAKMMLLRERDPYSLHHSCEDIVGSLVCFFWGGVAAISHQPFSRKVIFRQVVKKAVSYQDRKRKRKMEKTSESSF